VEESEGWEEGEAEEHVEMVGVLEVDGQLVVEGVEGVDAVTSALLPVWMGEVEGEEDREGEAD